MIIYRPIAPLTVDDGGFRSALKAMAWTALLGAPPAMAAASPDKSSAETGHAAASSDGVRGTRGPRPCGSRRAARHS